MQHTGFDVVLHSGSYCSNERLNPVYFPISVRVHLPRRQIQFFNNVCVFHRTLEFGRPKVSAQQGLRSTLTLHFKYCLKESAKTRDGILKPAGLFLLVGVWEMRTWTPQKQSNCWSQCHGNMQIWLFLPVITSPTIWINVAYWNDFFWHSESWTYSGPDHIQWLS